MDWTNITHKLKFSPNVNRALIPHNVSIPLYEKIYRWRKYEDYEDDSNPVYSRFLNVILKLFKKEKTLRSIIETLKNCITTPQVYGLKKDANGYRLEFYFYYNKAKNFTKDLMHSEYHLFLDILQKHGCNTESLQHLMKDIAQKPSTIWSFDFYDDENLFGDCVNFYEENGECINYVYRGKQFTLKENSVVKDGVFSCFPKRYDVNFKDDLKCNFTPIAEQKAKKILNKYNCLEHCVCNKKEIDGEPIFFVQYFGISDEEFMRFLKENDYSNILIDEIQNNLEFYKTMSKEITEVHDVSSDGLRAKRSALYGLI